MNMATDSSMAAATSSRSGGGGASADSYIGSLISLTSKSEIRYEGILYNINTEESSIGLRNVRSFGTEGRKKDGPQVPPSDKIYEYILFRGSDIKDLQVKASPPVQSTPPINNDPAIIQSQFPHHTTPLASLPTAPGSSLTDHSAHSGLPGSNFQSGLPLYQPGGNLNAWGPSPPNANGSGLAMPMYWQGFYGPPNGLPQQSLLRPPPGLSIPPSMQHMQFSGFNSSLPTLGSGLPTSNLPDYHSSLVPNTPSSSSLASTSLPASNSSLNLPPIQPMSFMSEAMNNLLPNKDPIAAISTSPPSNSMPSMSHLPSKDVIAPISTSAPSSNLPSLSHPPNSMPENLGAPLVASKPSAIPSTAALPLQTLSRHGTSVSGASPILTETPTPSLITPGHLLHSGPATGHTSQTMQTAQKDVEVVQVSSDWPPENSAPVVTEAQPPLLPLPQYSRAQKPNGGSSYYTRNNYHHYRGRGGRGSSRVVPRPVTKFTEDFDFTAMNEKFNKDEVWGHLGKSSKSPGKDKGNASGSDENDSQGDDSEMPKHDAMPVYNKDDFFDSLSCNALDNDPNHGRTRYSEQMKLDSETFGEISRYRGGRGRGPGRGGGRFRGSYHGRGYGGGYGYSNRGRGRGIQNRAS